MNQDTAEKIERRVRMLIDESENPALYDVGTYDLAGGMFGVFFETEYIYPNSGERVVLVLGSDEEEGRAHAWYETDHGMQYDPETGNPSDDPYPVHVSAAKLDTDVRHLLDSAAAWLFENGTQAPHALS